jgi:excinuclease ABC subunit A
VLNDLKKVFASIPEAIADGIAEADFSFNSRKSQCPKCKGLGTITTTLDFLPDVKEVCPECNGHRYSEKWLAYRVGSKSISEWLLVTVDEFLEADFISTKSKKILQQLQLVGLGYLALGQEVSTLSYGERRRLMLAESVAGLKREQAIILFDSPTRGLDWGNTHKLFQLFDRLVNEGHTVVIADSQEVEPLADFVRLSSQKSESMP